MLRSAGFNVDYKPGISREELIKIIEGYEVLVIRGRLVIDHDILKRAKKLKIIARAGSGVDNIDLEYAKSRNIEVIRVPEAVAQSVAELTIGLIISAMRMLPLYNHLVKFGKWPKGKFLGSELAGKKLGIIGFGHVGKRVATIAKAFGMEIIAYDIRDLSSVAKSLGIRFVKSLERVLREADIITLHVPLNEGTYHLISEKELKLMKKGVIIINTSRGAVLDTRAILKALKSGKVKAVALDVLENEPPKGAWELELIKDNRVIITPHIGAETREARRRSSLYVAKAIIERFSRRIKSSHPSSQQIA